MVMKKRAYIGIVNDDVDCFCSWTSCAWDDDVVISYMNYWFVCFIGPNGNAYRVGRQSYSFSLCLPYSEWAV